MRSTIPGWPTATAEIPGCGPAASCRTRSTSVAASSRRTSGTCTGRIPDLDVAHRAREATVLSSTDYPSPRTCGCSARRGSRSWRSPASRPLAACRGPSWRRGLRAATDEDLTTSRRPRAGRQALTGRWSRLRNGLTVRLGVDVRCGPVSWTLTPPPDPRQCGHERARLPRHDLVPGRSRGRGAGAWLLRLPDPAQRRAHRRAHGRDVLGGVERFSSSRDSSLAASGLWSGSCGPS